MMMTMTINITNTTQHNINKERKNNLALLQQDKPANKTKTNKQKEAKTSNR